MPQSRIRAQLRNGDTPSVSVFVKTQDGVSSRVNAVYTVETYIVELHRLLPFDSTSNMVNEENEKAGVASISVVSTPRKGGRT